MIRRARWALMVVTGLLLGGPAFGQGEGAECAPPVVDPDVSRLLEADAVVEGTVVAVGDGERRCRCEIGSQHLGVLEIRGVLRGSACLLEAENAFREGLAQGAHLHLLPEAIARLQAERLQAEGSAPSPILAVIVFSRQYVGGEWVYDHPVPVPGDGGVWALHAGRGNVFAYERIPSDAEARVRALLAEVSEPVVVDPPAPTPAGPGAPRDLGAGLCAACQGRAFTADIGACGSCGGTTESGSWRRCRACAVRDASCAACGAPLAAPSEDAADRDGDGVPDGRQGGRQAPGDR